MNVRNFLSKAEEAKIVQTIKEGELKTSGEIRVHLENHCPTETLQHARTVFGEMGMHETEEHTGVLLYIAVQDHKIAIVGDEGISAKVPPDFWECIIEQLTTDFKAEKYCEGICTTLTTVAEELSFHFPYKEDDIDELPNDISFGE